MTQSLALWLNLFGPIRSVDGSSHASLLLFVLYLLVCHKAHRFPTEKVLQLKNCATAPSLQTPLALISWSSNCLFLCQRRSCDLIWLPSCFFFFFRGDDICLGSDCSGIGRRYFSLLESAHRTHNANLRSRVGRSDFIRCHYAAEQGNSLQASKTN